MKDKDYKKICERCIAVVKEVGDFIRQELGNVRLDQIVEKELNSLVSYVDKSAERQLILGLAEILPRAGFITEEDTIEQEIGGGTAWIIDPLDGTSNFLQGIPHFAISVGLRVDDTIKVGIVLDIMREECFYAWHGGSAFMNGQTIRVSQTKTLDSAIIGTGFPYHIDDVNVNPLMDTLEYFVRNGRGIRRMGAAALDLVYVACGRLDIYYESTLNAWDIAGGSLIITEAGGAVTDYYGGSRYLESGRVVVGNASLQPLAQSILFKKYDL